ncbi:MAG TPA: hypothetical protein VID25_11925, partial [Candidatus Limnocylindrales bacterium]
MIPGGVASVRRWLTALGRWLGPGAATAGALAVTRPLGPLAGTMLLVLVLPPLAAALEVLGWAGIVAGVIQRARLSVRTEVLA